MTGVLQPFTDDAFLSTLDANSSFGSLRPLDFSNLMGYVDAPIGVSPAACPSLFSPSLSRQLQTAASPTVRTDLQLGGLPQQNAANLHDPFSAFFKPVSPKSTRASAPASMRPEAEFTRHESEIQHHAPPAPAMMEFVPAETTMPAEPVPMHNPVVNLDSALPAKEENLLLSGVAQTPQVGTQPQTVMPPTSVVSKLGAPKVAPAGEPKKVTFAASEQTLERRKSSPKKPMSTIEKAAERRRKNRESSSRCYYNRKRIIENLDKQISEEKRKLTSLYDRALELRHENARLKKDVVTHGIALPTAGMRTAQGYTTSGAPTFQLQGYLQLLQSNSYQQRH